MAYSSVGDEVWQRIVACHSSVVTRRKNVSRFSDSPTGPRTGRAVTNRLTRSHIGPDKCYQKVIEAPKVTVYFVVTRNKCSWIPNGGGVTA